MVMVKWERDIEWGEEKSKKVSGNLLPLYLCNEGCTWVNQINDEIRFFLPEGKLLSTNYTHTIFQFMHVGESEREREEKNSNWIICIEIMILSTTPLRLHFKGIINIYIFQAIEKNSNLERWDYIVKRTNKKKMEKKNGSGEKNLPQSISDRW